MSRLRRSTASSMSTSMLRTKSGRRGLRLGHPPRDRLLEAREVLRRGLALAGLGLAGHDGGRRLALARLGLGPPPRPAPRPCAPSPLAAASTSALTIRPPGPVPWSWPSSSPSSRAIRRATGDALARPPLPPPPARRARPRPSAGRRLGASAGARGSASLLAAFGLAALGSLRRVVSADGAVAAAADRRDRRADGERVALLGDDLQRPLLVGLVRHVGLVGLDLDELLALGDLVPVGLEPLEDRALLHRVGQAGHRDVGHGPECTDQARDGRLQAGEIEALRQLEVVRGEQLLVGEDLRARTVGDDAAAGRGSPRARTAGRRTAGRG